LITVIPMSERHVSFSEAKCTPHPEGIALWRDAVDASELFLLAGLRRKIGPDGDLKAAYRRWYEQHMKEHDRMLARLGHEFSRRGGGGHGG
jgi:hypothetical protein